MDFDTDLLGNAPEGKSFLQRISPIVSEKKSGEKTDPDRADAHMRAQHGA